MHRQTVSLSELFSVARHAGRSKPESKPVQLYVRLRLQTTRGLRWLREFLGILYLANSSSSLCLHFFIPYRLPESSILSKRLALR